MKNIVVRCIQFIALFASVFSIVLLIMASLVGVEVDKMNYCSQIYFKSACIIPFVSLVVLSVMRIMRERKYMLDHVRGIYNTFIHVLMCIEISLTLTASIFSVAYLSITPMYSNITRDMILGLVGWLLLLRGFTSVFWQRK